MPKKLLLSIFTALLVSASFTCITANALALGDVNNDFIINASDASAVLEHSASVGAGNDGIFSEDELISADVNADGIVDAGDASEILVYAAELGAGGSPVFSGEKIINNDAWKQAYQIQLASLTTDNYYSSYDLADINQDSVPELFISLWDTEKATQTTMIYSYQNGMCQPVVFQTKSGAVTTSLNTDYINYSADTNSLMTWTYPGDGTATGDEYQITNTSAVLKHQYIEDDSGDETYYYYDDIAVTEEQYQEFFKNEESYFYYWFSHCSAENNSLLNAYSTTGTLQASFGGDSVIFDWNACAVQCDINCQNITENCYATVNLVPHGTAHTLENAGEENSWYLYTVMHEDEHYFYDSYFTTGTYDLFILADDGVTELDSVTFTVPEDTRYQFVYQQVLSGISDSDYMYSLYDLNSDGIPELFISTGDYHAAGIELYTCSGGTLEQLHNEEYGLGSYGTVNVSGNILLSWHYGMDYESAFFYRMTDSTTLELQDEFSINHNTSPAEYQYFGTDITETEYHNLHAPYDNLSYIELGRDYNISNTAPIQNYNQ